MREEVAYRFGKIESFTEKRNNAEVSKPYGFIRLSDGGGERVYFRLDDLDGSLAGRRLQGMHVAVATVLAAKGLRATHVEARRFTGVYATSLGPGGCEHRLYTEEENILVKESPKLGPGKHYSFCQGKKPEGEGLVFSLQNVAVTGSEWALLAIYLRWKDWLSPTNFLKELPSATEDPTYWGHANMVLDRVVGAVGERDLASWFPEIHRCFPLALFRGAAFRINVHRYLGTPFFAFFEEALRGGWMELAVAAETAIRSDLEQGSTAIAAGYWLHVPALVEKVEYRGAWWDFAPLWLKRELILRRFPAFGNAYLRWKGQPCCYTAHCVDPQDPSLAMEDKDVLLIRDFWPNRGSSEMERNRSARIAEKAASLYFRLLGHEVEDLSIQQVEGISGEWGLADLRLDSRWSVDVKNARKAEDRPTYSEFCVPQLKTNRGQDVVILAVLSPMGAVAARERHNRDLKILGHFTRSMLRELESWLESPDLKVDMRRSLEPGAGQFLPPWVFDHGRRFYAARNVILDSARGLREEDFPAPEDAAILGVDMLPVFVAAKLPLPRPWENSLLPGQSKLVKRLRSAPGDRITLPILFLASLAEFLDAVRTGASDMSGALPTRLCCLVHPILDPIDLLGQAPIGVLDPLEVLATWESTLQDLWKHRHMTGLAGLKWFRFKGRGLLQGKASKDEVRWTSILAYCGGRRPDNSKCSFSPLVLGPHVPCPRCGHLICPECDYCSQECPRPMTGMEEFGMEEFGMEEFLEPVRLYEA